MSAPIDPQPRVFIVDDDDSVRSGLEEFLASHGFETESFSSAESFIERLPIDAAGCIVLDIEMPGMSGMDLQTELASRGCQMPIVFLTAHGTIPDTVTAIKAGAEDFLPKMADEEELVGAVRRAIQRSVGTLEQQRRISYLVRCAASLTAREREVCEHLIAGWLSKQIARQLDISERTVKAHKASVMQKFQVDSIAQLVILATQAGITAREKSG